MKVIITGANGQLGRCLQDKMPKHWQVFAFGSQELNITQFEQVKNKLSEIMPTVVINAAAYTAVDKAETDTDNAFLVNSAAVGQLAKATYTVGTRLIHISTDYVFDGSSSEPYTTLDTPNPINMYGKSKLAGELLVLAHNPRAQVIRTSWLYSEYGNNFVKTMLELADEDRDSVNVVDDQMGCPTYAGNLALFIIELINEPIEKRLLHFSDGEVMSWYTFAQAIFAERAKNGNAVPKVNPISTSSYPMPAKRPKYSVLKYFGNFKNTCTRNSLFQVISKN
nr:dTDP-4-dehydrorhamnose reductase [Moraxella sp. CTOTU49097]